ncbi:MAG: hypothetical protein IPM16_14185 [Chloroflexi bacterium]|nr:hypothetical protein [Chloroflexota bacterium]
MPLLRLTAWSILIVSLAVIAQPAAACTGPYPFTVNQLSQADVIVSATVIDADERGHSAILLVDAYFKGMGAPYLAVVRVPVAMHIATMKRNYDVGCAETGAGVLLKPGMTGYFALANNGDGTYTDKPVANTTTATFSVEAGHVEFSEQLDGMTRVRAVDTVQFEELLLEAGGRLESVAPDFSDARMPLPRFLLVTSESGQQYRVNPDRTVTRMTEHDPIAISPDGIHVAFRVDGQHVGLQYVFLDPAPEESVVNPLIRVPGHGVLFSPDSDFAAVFEPTRLTVYLLENREVSLRGQRLTLQKVAETALESESAAPLVMWSADSSTIAFQDARGVWVWDLFDSGAPTALVVTGDGEQALSDISRTGRFVRVGGADSWRLYDISAGTHYERAVATPDENNIVYVVPGDPSADRFADPQRACTAPLAETCPIFIETFDNPLIFPYRNDHFGVVSCSDSQCWASSHSWKLGRGHEPSVGGVLNMPVLPVRALAYDRWNERAALATGEYRVELGFFPAWYDRADSALLPDVLDLVDLSPVLDSPIATLEWGQPIFYDDWILLPDPR